MLIVPTWFYVKVKQSCVKLKLGWVIIWFNICVISCILYLKFWNSMNINTKKIVWSKKNDWKSESWYSSLRRGSKMHQMWHFPYNQIPPFPTSFILNLFPPNFTLNVKLIIQKSTHTMGDNFSSEISFLSLISISL